MAAPSANARTSQVGCTSVHTDRVCAASACSSHQHTSHQHTRADTCVGPHGNAFASSSDAADALQVMIWDDHQGRCIGELTFRNQV